MNTSPFQLGPTDSEKPKLSALLKELEMARRFTLSVARDLTAEQLAATPVAGKNTIGSVLSHLAAAETVMQRVTTLGEAFPEGTESEREVFGFVRDPLKGSELAAYVAALTEVRDRTKEIFAERDDDWLEQPRTFLFNPANFHYYWFHLILDEARHQGQMILLRKYLTEGADPDFNPYSGLAAKSE